MLVRGRQFGIERSALFRAQVKTAGVAHRCGRDNGITFHSFRHTFGTRMAAAGAPMRAIQEWMGHRDIRTTQTYADYSPDPRTRMGSQSVRHRPGRTVGCGVMDTPMWVDTPATPSNLLSSPAHSGA